MFTKIKSISFILFVYFTLQFVHFSCKKKSNSPEPSSPSPPSPRHFDTIKPGNYFPVYPGSFWKYSLKGGGTITYTTGLSYVLNSFCPEYHPNNTTGNGTCNNPSDSVYVTTFNGEAIYGYRKVQREISHPGMASRSSLVPFLSEKIGSTFLDPYYCTGRFYYSCLQEETVVNKKIPNVNKDSVIIVTGRYVDGNSAYPPNNQKAVQITYREYVKNIGLTRYFIYDTLVKDTIYNMRLLDYKIGK